MQEQGKQISVCFALKTLLEDNYTVSSRRIISHFADSQLGQMELSPVHVEIVPIPHLLQTQCLCFSLIDVRQQ
jgi:hypothetical protein